MFIKINFKLPESHLLVFQARPPPLGQRTPAPLRTNQAKIEEDEDEDGVGAVRRPVLPRTKHPLCARARACTRVCELTYQRLNNSRADGGTDTKSR